MLFKVNNRLGVFRNAIGKQGVNHVQTYMRNLDVFEIQEYLDTAFEYYGEIPFLYRKFNVTEEVVSTEEERGGVKVVSDLYLESTTPPTLAYTKHTGPQWALPPQCNHADDVDLLPIHQDHRCNCRYQGQQGQPSWCTCTCLRISKYLYAAPVFRAEACFQVCRALQMYRTGVFIDGTSQFCEREWGKEMEIYLKLIDDMKPSRWESFYGDLRSAESFGEQLNEVAYSAPRRHAGRGPSKYHIQDSDPAEPSNIDDMQ